jgi:hypothetical protein
MPSEPPPGFATIRLIPPAHSALRGNSSNDTPAGSVWYRVIDAGATDYSATFEWYLKGDHLRRNWVYRIELAVDSQPIYSIGSAHTDGNGSMTNHGAITRLADRYCVGAPAPPQPFTTKLLISMRVKSDGSGSGPVTARGPSIGHLPLPCNGNGDSNFEYWLVSSGPFSISNAGK